jgi:hemerythrin-like domain-containing protein
MSTTKSRRARGATDVLQEDHQVLRDLLTELEETTPRGIRKRRDLLARVGREVRIHMRVEEEIFYPAYRGATKSQEDARLFFEAAEEHSIVAHVLPLLEETDPSNEVFGARAKVLKDLIEHHVEEEEEQMFPRARRLLNKEALLELGWRLEQRRIELEGDGTLLAGSPPATDRARNRHPAVSGRKSTAASSRVRARNGIR